MGFFGGGGNSGAQNESNQLIDQQFKQNQADIEERRRKLYADRLDIVHGQAGQTWKPKREAPNLTNPKNGREV